MKRQNEITVILGKKGYGKTSYLIAVTDELERAIFFDYNREYQKGLIVDNPRALIEQLRVNKKFFRLIYRPSPAYTIETHFKYFSEICFAVKNCTVICEEVDLVSAAGKMPWGLKQIINYGRHKAINLYALSRRAHAIPRDLTANADAIVTFCQQEPRDIKYLTDFMGESNAETVRNLARTETHSEFLKWNAAEKSPKVGKIFFVDKKIVW